MVWMCAAVARRDAEKPEGEAVPTAHDICPHLTVCLSFHVDLSKKQESGNAMSFDKSHL